MQRAILFLLCLSVAATAAQAQEKYQRKSGLWELKRTSTVSHGQTRVYQLCVDRASDDALSPLADGVPGERCKVTSAQRQGDRLAVDAQCNLSRTVATTHAVITGNFDSAYKTESKSTFEPPLRGYSDATAVLEARLTGECKPGQRAGDVIGPRGEKFNVNDAGKPKDAGNTGQQKPAGRQKGRYTPPSASATTPNTPPATAPSTPPATAPSTPPATK